MAPPPPQPIARWAPAALLALALAAPAARAQGIPFGFPGGPAAPGPAVVVRIPLAAGASAAPPPLVVPPTVSREAPDDVFAVVPLRYADVSEVVGLITAGQVKPNDNFTPVEPAFGSPPLQGSFASASGVGSNFLAGSTAASAQEALGQTVDEAVGVDRRLNAIVLRGAPARVAALRAKIAQLDVPVSSIVLETVFVELTESGARNIGLNLSNANNQLGLVSYSFGVGGSTLGSGEAGAAGGLAVSLQAAIYAQIAKGNGRIVSKPRIAAQNGGTAKIVTGDALPILTSIALSGVNAVQQEVQYVNVGVTLQIAPRVSDDGFVTSHIFAEVSSVTGFSQGYPTISQREASTSATVRDGESFVVGGLSQESRLAQRSKLPGLGSLPLLGALFGAETSSSAKTDLYIVVTPLVVRVPGPGPAAPGLAADPKPPPRT